MIPEEVRIFREAAQVLLTLLRCVAMKRAMSVDENDHLNFFRVYDGCLMDTIALSWCKLFGSPKEDLHWKKLFPETGGAVRPKLESDLKKSVGDLDALSKELRSYRDTYVAHHDLDESKRAKSHLKLNSLQETGWILYKEVFEALKQVRQEDNLPGPSKINGSNLDEIEIHWKAISNKAREATKEFSDCPQG